MSRSRVSFEAASQSLLGASLDPSRWTESMGTVAQYAGAVGAALLPLRGRTPQMPFSESAAECIDVYFKEGWYLRDERDRGLPLLQRRQIYGDQDFATREEIETSDYYRGFVGKFHLNWSVSIGMSSLNDDWCLVIGRGKEAGLFDENEKSDLVRFSEQLKQAALISRHVASAYNTGTLNTYDAIGCPAFLLDSSGRVIRHNSQADQLIGNALFLSRGALRCAAQHDSAALAKLIAELTTESGGARLVPMMALHQPLKRPLVIQGVKLKGLEDNVFAPAAYLLLVSDTDKPAITGSEHLKLIFGLTSAEANLVSLLEQGLSLNDVAERMGIARETVRFYLKRVFAKTDVNRQSDLLLLARRMPPG